MKTLFSFFAILLWSIPSSGQWVTINFENPISQNYFLSIDTASNPNCTWQIGVPNKTVFQSAYSVEHAIVTDTINPVPANDTSTFVLRHILNPFGPYHILGLGFWFKMDGDSTDFGTVELSVDGGNTWIDVLSQDTQYGIDWQAPKPTLQGSTVGWQYFWFNDLSSLWSLYPTDTVFYRFTYITDSDSTPRDGWMIDDIYPMDYWEGIEESQNDNMISISPNPVSDKLRIQRKKTEVNGNCQLLNSTGQIISENFQFNGESVDVGNLPNGIYFLRYSDGIHFSVKKFVVQHE